VGGVSGRPAREAEESDLFRARARGGGKHPVSGKASSFAGRRWNEGLGRSDSFVEVSSSAGRRTGDSGCSSDAEEGNECQLAANKARAPYARVRKRTSRAQGTRPSLGPKACACQSWLNAPWGNSRAVRRAQSHRGRASSGNREEPAPRRRSNGQRAARHASPLSQGRQRDAHKKRKVVAATVPARTRESWSKCPHVVVVAEVGRRTSGLEYARAQGSEKSDGASERGPSSEPSSAVKRRRELRVKGRRDLGRDRTCDGHGSGSDPGWREIVIQRSSRDSRKAARWSRDRGRNGHRILRRVPTDGRHSWSSRAIVFHEAVVKVAFGGSPRSKAPRRRMTSGGAETREGESVLTWSGTRERRQGCQRLDRTQSSVGRKRPRSLRYAGETGTERGPGGSTPGTASSVDPPKRIERRENARSPGQAARIPESVRHPRGESRGRSPGTCEVRVHATYVRVAEVDRTHRASCPSGDRKVSWGSRQGASRKEARSTV